MPSKKALLIVILAVSFVGIIGVVAGGSIFAVWGSILAEDAGDTQQQTQETTQQLQSCSNVIIEISRGSASTALVRQVAGSEPVGDITVTWYYEERNPVQAEGSIDDSRGAIQVSSGASGTLEEITAEPTGCEGAESASYTP